MNKFDRCPCASKALYHKCCQKYHLGAYPESALLLMRSRYCAYVLGLADYIINTTHPDHPEWKRDREVWKADIIHFSKNTRFDHLKIIDFTDGQEIAYVTFLAELRQADKDSSFTERSLFEKVNGGRWLYKSGELIQES